MSVVFIIGSEEELSTGAAWCDQLRRQRGSDVHLVVPGPDRKALCELARRRVSELLDSNDVAVHAELVEASPASVRKYARSVGCKALLMVYRDDDAKFQQQVFEESRFAAAWLRPVGSPPTSNDQIKSLFRPPGRATGAA